ncbi:MAG: c-type cytochrome domain-containing protein, partial [Isosphaeraceae bacterium]
MPSSPTLTGRLGAAMVALLAMGLAQSARAQDAGAIEFFEAKVRPLLIRECRSCHSGEARKGGLSLESRASILEGGDSGPAAVPGNPGESLLIEAIRHESEPKMPPKKKLSEPEIAVLTRWVELGMPWPDGGKGAGKPTADHWAFRPVAKVEPPAVRDLAWVRDPIDRFVLARLEAEGLKPAPVADRRTLIRRLSYDL